MFFYIIGFHTNLRPACIYSNIVHSENITRLIMYWPNELSRALYELGSQALNMSGEQVESSFIQVRLAIVYRVMSNESNMYHLLIEWVSTVTSSSSDRV
jgi:hypothetical protein